jgi:hypothetical protein
MKNLIVFVLAILVFNITYSQEVRIETNKVDEFNGTKSITTSLSAGKYTKRSDYIDLDGSLLITLGYSLSADSVELYIFNIFTTRANKLGCLSEYNGKCIFLFEDGETQELTQFSNTNCNSNSLYAMYVFWKRDQIDYPEIRDIMFTNIEKASTKRINKIRIYGTEGIADYTLKEEKKDILIKHFKVINESK